MDKPDADPERPGRPLEPQLSIPLPIPEPIASEVVPLFPLPDLYLFPGTAIPLHVFEPRYRQMVEDLLDGRGRLVLGTVLPGHESELAGAPPCADTAGLGEIVKHHKLPDERYLILVLGLKRVRIQEVPSDRLYRKVNASPLQETPPDAGAARELRAQLVAALRQRVGAAVDIPNDVPVGVLADLLLLKLQPNLDDQTLSELSSCLDVASRARGALTQHEQRRPPAAPTSTGES